MKSFTDLNHSKTRLLVDFPTLILILHIRHLKSYVPTAAALNVICLDLESTSWIWLGLDLDPDLSLYSIWL